MVVQDGTAVPFEGSEYAQALKDFMRSEATPEQKLFALIDGLTEELKLT